MDELIYGNNILQLLSSNTTIILNSGSPAKIIKVKAEHRSIACDFDPNTRPDNEKGIIEYLFSTDTSMKYLAKELNLMSMRRSDIRKLIEELEVVEAAINIEYPMYLKRYKDLSETVKLYDAETIYNFPTNSPEYELYNLRQYLIMNSPIKIPGETDEDFIVRLRDIEGIQVYRSKCHIPKDSRDFEKERELLKAINRVNKRKSTNKIQLMKNQQMNVPITQVICDNGLIIEFI